MYPNIRRLFRHSLLGTLGLAFALSVMWPPLCHAAKLKALQHLHDDASRLVNRSRGLAVAILKQIKSMDESCRRRGGEPVQDKEPLARQILGRIEPLRESFDNNVRDAEKAIDRFNHNLAKIESPGEEERKLKEDVDLLRADLAKYEGYVEKFFDRSLRDFGSPIRLKGGVFAGMAVPAQRAPGLRISGELSSAGGGSSYKRPHQDPRTSLTSGDLNLKVAGTFWPSALTQINFRGSRQNTIEQRKIALTEAGAGVSHTFQGGVRLGVDLSYSGYDDVGYDSLDFEEFSTGGGFGYGGQRIQADIRAKHLSRSYKDSKSADYKTLLLQPDLNIRVGMGSINLGTVYLSKSNEMELLDHRELSPYFRWEFSRGGPELNFQFQQFTYPNQNNSQDDNNRIKASFFNKTTSASGRVRYGPEVAIYRYPNAEDKDFADYGLALSHQSFGRQASMLSLRAIYRIHEDTLQYDFAQVTLRKSKRPVGSGFSWESNLAGRYYTESSDKDDSLRLANVHPPHTLDSYYRMGWVITGRRALREVAFGPITGAKFYFDTEWEDAFENDVDYVWRNPQNTVVGGVYLKTVILPSPVFRIRAGGRYQVSFLYNAEPVRNYSLADVNLSAEYALGRQLHIEARGNMHLTRADIESDTDLEKTDFGLVVRYLLDVVR